METKTCTKCGEVKPLSLEYFNRQTKSESGFRAACRACRKLEYGQHIVENRKKSREYYQRDPAARAAAAKARRDADPEAESQRKKARYWADPETHRARALAYHFNNRDDRLAAHRRWRDANPDKIKANNTRWHVMFGKAYYAQHAEKLRARTQAYRLADPQKHAERRAELYRENAEVMRAKARANYLLHRAKNLARGQRWRLANLEKHRALAAAWRLNNPDRVRQNQRRRSKERYAEDPNYILAMRIRPAIRYALLRASVAGSATRTLRESLGYSVDELRKHIERQFKRGMSWENYGKWHIDHIIALSCFDFTSTDDPAFRAAWALSNLRPLWAKDNQAKSAKRLTLL
tara:strand:+ start:135 stop:1178 length:1044 start_codon:yes stop_codon:yes gene_type:complete